MNKLKEINWDDAITYSSPHQYVLAVTCDREGKNNIIGLGWWTICSWNPPMIAISVGKKRFTRECLDATSEFVLCFVPEEKAEAAWICGNISGRTTDKFKEAGFTPVSSRKVKPATIDESILAFECKVKGKMETGDHILYAGEVVNIRGIPEKRSHLYSIHYKKLVSISPDGKFNFDLKFK